MRDKRAYLFAILVVLGTALYFWAQHELTRAERLGSVTAFSGGATGASYFAELAKDSVSFNRRAVLTQDALDDVESLVILSPTVPISTHEARLIATFAKSGGKLLLGFHTNATHTALLPLLAELAIDEPLVDNPSYAKGRAAEVTMSENRGLFHQGEKYAFYSALCLGKPDNYVVHRAVEDGEVLLVAGLPPMANALIGHADNRLLAFRLQESWGPVVIDEYHHFFTDKSAWDLWRNPTFALPLAGLMIALLLYFLFAHTEFHERTAVRQIAPARSFHDLNEQILLSVFEGPDANASALRLHENFLRRLFPKDREKIDRLVGGRHTNEGRLTRSDLLARGARLIKFHRERLESRGAPLYRGRHSVDTVDQ